jgi:hypothetical protein
MSLDGITGTSVKLSVHVSVPSVRLIFILKESVGLQNHDVCVFPTSISEPIHRSSQNLV